MLAELTKRIEERMGATTALTTSVRFELEDGSIVLTPGAESPVHNDASAETDCVIKVAAEDLNAMLDGTLDASNAFMMGRLQVTGDMTAAVQLSQAMKA